MSRSGEEWRGVMERRGVDQSGAKLKRGKNGIMSKHELARLIYIYMMRQRALVLLRIGK